MFASCILTNYLGILPLLGNNHFWGFPGGTSGKEPACQCRRHRFSPWLRKIPWRRAWQFTPVFLPGESHEQRSLAGYSPWGGAKSRTQPKRLSTPLALKTGFQSWQQLPTQPKVTPLSAGPTQNSLSEFLIEVRRSQKLTFFRQEQSKDYQTCDESWQHKRECLK